MTTYVGTARTEHETGCHKEKVTSVSCITQVNYRTSFLRGPGPIQNTGGEMTPAFSHVL